MDHLPAGARTTNAMPARLPRGTVLGRYSIDGWLREGGMAALYRAHHVATGARVAIKVQRTSDEDDATVAARFVREGQVMGRLSGMSNVVQVQDMGELPDGRRYLVMEWVEGDNLEERLDGLRNADTMLSIDDACRLLTDVARALDAVHRAAVVHRDVKPSNIMIDRGLADREVAKLLDFGISADLGAGGQSMDLTAAGVVLGTSGYVAPEQALGFPAHPAFDVYALGVVLFEAITGRGMPPESLGPVRLPPLGQLRKGVPAGLQSLVERCMARDPMQRPASAAEVAEVLEGVRSQRAAERSMTAMVVERPASVEGAAAASIVAGTVERPASVGGAEASIVAGTVERESPPMPSARPRWLRGVGVGVLVLGGVIVGWALAARRDPPPETSETGSMSGVQVDSAEGASSGVVDEDPTNTHVDLEPVSGPKEPNDDEGVGETTNSTDAGGSKSGPSRPAPRSHCRRARGDAQVAVGRRDWPGVLRASADQECWSSSGQGVERKLMRVRAWLELERYDRCVRDGKGETDPRIARLTRHCREKLAGRGG